LTVLNIYTPTSIAQKKNKVLISPAVDNNQLSPGLTANTSNELTTWLSKSNTTKLIRKASHKLFLQSCLYVCPGHVLLRDWQRDITSSQLAPMTIS
jgi:hypothetical protein